ncbi:hypothetical protein LSTR_LSTR004328 [Laodelphax striatellus]|uniref:ISXO2-like transposase domain-containing protein n=1 Tax=Laodelphax striatellus TaxID=195883 RepID=A0A482X934_LAOST|nr:hypothetical protein LSTR_LSTR004328 [Laodelphax striatellus]
MVKMASEKLSLVVLKGWSDLKDKTLIEKCMEWGILKRDVMCLACAPDKCKMTLRKDSNEIDGYRWRCNNVRSKRKQKRKRCTYSKSLRTGTFFEKSKLPMWKILGFVQLWTKNVAADVISEELDISKHTVVDWGSFCREVTFDAIMNRRTKIGGPGQKVQIDVCKFGQRKYNRGRVVEGQWVFGGVDEASGEVFMTIMENRTSETLIPMIKKFIKPGTTIVSDFFKVSGCLKEEDFEHLKVSHKIDFVDTNSGANTSKIEALWSAVRSSLPRYNRKKSFAGHLSKYLFLKSCKLRKVNCLMEFCKEAGDLYNGCNNKETTTDEFEEIDDFDMI